MSMKPLLDAGLPLEACRQRLRRDAERYAEWMRHANRDGLTACPACGLTAASPFPSVCPECLPYRKRRPV
jgi:hypothetical protein